MCTAAIIAGGEARRLNGRVKGTLPFGTTSLVERQIAVLRAITEKLLIITNNESAYTGLGIPVINDEIPGSGAIGGIYTALVHATVDPVLVVACDMPFVNEPFLRLLVSADRSADVTIPKTTNGYEPMCACYSRRCASRLRQQINNGALKIQELLPHLRVREVGIGEIAPHDPSGLLFSNVNTPDDYAKALQHLDSDHSMLSSPKLPKK